jgi:hypothetical protein
MKTRIIFLISAIMILSVCTVHAQYTVSLVGSTNPSTGQPTVYYTQWKLNGVNTSTPPVAGDWYWEAIIGVKYCNRPDQRKSNYHYIWKRRKRFCQADVYDFLRDIYSTIKRHCGHWTIMYCACRAVIHRDQRWSQYEYVVWSRPIYD